MIGRLREFFRTFLLFELARGLMLTGDPRASTLKVVK